MTILIAAVLGLPVLLAAVALVAPHHPMVRHIPVAASAVVLATGLLALATVHASPSAEFTAAGGLLRVDALTAYLLTVVGAVAVTATGGATTARPSGRFSALMCLFLTAMALAVLADNLGVLWVAIEATTITTAFLVGSGGGRHRLEAAWKYVVLGSVGVAIALLGIVLLYAAGTGSSTSLSWSALMTTARLDADTARVGLALAALGLATKAGLAPMHSWLPDAHSQAPPQVSGLMSGVLLSVAFYGILRFKAISDHLLGPGLMETLLAVAGVLSLLVAAGLSLTQKDFKRLLAYSSIEHMGILAVGAAIGGPLAIGAVLLHILGHGLAKASMFVLAGRLLKVAGSHRIQDVHSLLTSHPSIGRPWLVGTGALLGFPPFGLFFTEAAIIIAGFARGKWWLTGALLVLLLAVLAGIARHTLSMTLTGHDAEAPMPSTPDPSTRAQRAVTWTALAVVGLLGVLAWPLRPVLAAAVAALGGPS